MDCMDFISGTSVDLLTEVVGYLFQSLGLLFFALIVGRARRLPGGCPFLLSLRQTF